MHMKVEHEGDFGEGTVAVDLVKNGGSVALTNENRRKYVELYVEHLLLKSVEQQRKAFYRGFHKVRTRATPCCSRNHDDHSSFTA